MPWFFGAQFVGRFSGEKETTRFSQWLQQVEAFLRAQSLEPQQGVDFLLSTLDGTAHREAALLPPAHRITPQRLIKALAEKYGDQRSPDTLQEQFFNCRQAHDEDGVAFALRVREYLQRWQMSDPDRVGNTDKRLRTQFAKGLRNGVTKRELLRRTPQATSEVCREATQIEKEEQEAAGEAATCRVAATSCQRSSRDEVCLPKALQQMRDSLRAELQQDLWEQVELLGKTLIEELRGPRQIPDAPSTLRGRRQYRQAPREALGHRWDEQGRPICSDCGEVGHVQRFCPSRSSRQRDFCPGE